MVGGRFGGTFRRGISRIPEAQLPTVEPAGRPPRRPRRGVWCPEAVRVETGRDSVTPIDLDGHYHAVRGAKPGAATSDVV